MLNCSILINICHRVLNVTVLILNVTSTPVLQHLFGMYVPAKTQVRFVVWFQHRDTSRLSISFSFSSYDRCPKM